MNYTRALTAAEEAALQSKADRDKTTITAMLDAKIDQYLGDVARDNGTDTMSKVTAAIADPAKLAIAKDALGL